MKTNEKTPVAVNEQGARELVQPNVTTGYETCQDIPTIKEELARLNATMRNTASAGAYERDAIRYWAIRWVMGWEKEIPE